VLGGQLADMTFCDPPYNVDYANSPKDKLRGKHRPILNDDLGGGFDAFLYDACVNILSVTKGACYICMSSSELHSLQRAFAAAGGKWSTFVIWAKNTFTLGRADYHASMSRSFTAGRRAAIITGAGPGTRGMCGSSTSRPGTICTRR
jgi:DNA modification methylase